jgi:hypothetical protein
MEQVSMIGWNCSKCKLNDYEKRQVSEGVPRCKHIVKGTLCNHEYCGDCKSLYGTKAEREQKIQEAAKGKS